MRLLMLLVAFLASNNIAAEEYDPVKAVEAYVKERDAQREKELELERGRLKKTRDRKSADNLRKSIAYLESDRFRPRLMDGEIGSAGRLRSCEVYSVISESEIVADVHVKTNRAPESLAEVSAWIDNIDTTGVTDDHELEDVIVHIVGTKMYGGSTMLHMRAFGAEEWELVKKLDAAKAESEALTTAKTSDERNEKPIRTWKDATGKFSIDARFRGFISGTLTITTKDGRDVELPLEKLSAEDQEYVQALFRK